MAIKNRMDKWLQYIFMQLIITWQRKLINFSHSTVWITWKYAAEGIKPDPEAHILYNYKDKKLEELTSVIRITHSF